MRNEEFPSVPHDPVEIVGGWVAFLIPNSSFLIPHS